MTIDGIKTVANDNIIELVDTLIDYIKEYEIGYGNCPYNKENCHKKECEECASRYFEKRRNELLDEYLVT